MRTICRTLLFGLVAALAAGCVSNDTIDDSDVNEETFYGEYRMHYDEADAVLEYYAQLRVGGSTGTTVRLVEGSIAVDGTPMRLIDGDERTFNFEGSYYTLDRSTDDPATMHTFAWTRSDGTVYENPVRIVPGFTIDAPRHGASHGGGALAVTLGGPDLLGGERYTVVLEDTDGNRVSASTRSGDRVIVPAEDVADLEPGTIELRVTRSHTSDPKAGHDDEGGDVRSSRSIAPIQLVLSAGD